MRVIRVLMLLKKGFDACIAAAGEGWSFGMLVVDAWVCKAVAISSKTALIVFSQNEQKQ